MPDATNERLSAVANIGVRVAGMALAFLLSVVLARTMGTDAFGIYSFAFAVSLLLSVVIRLGFPPLIVRELSRYRVATDWRSARGLLIRCVQVVLVVSLVSAVIVTPLALFADGRLPAVRAAAVLWGLVLAPVLALTVCASAALRAMGQVVRGQLIEQVLRPAGVLAAIAVLFLVGGAAAVVPEAAMSLHALGAAIALVIGGVLLIRALPRGIGDQAPVYSDQPQWRRALFALSLFAGLQVVTAQTDIVLLGLLREADEVGVYRVAWQVANLVNMALYAVALSAEPAIARLHSLGEGERVQAFVERSGRLAFGLSAALALVLAVAGRPLLGLVFGADFAVAYLPLVILALGQVALAFAGWSVLTLNMTGNERTTVRVTAIAAVVNVAANAVLIPRYGAIGAAIATAAVMFGWKLALAIAARRTTGIHTMVFFGPSERKRGKP